MTARKPAPSASLRRLALWLLAVLSGFLAVTVVVQRRTEAIDRLARTISEEAGPSIDQLTAARGAFHRLAQEVRRAIRAPASTRAADRAAIEQARADLHAQLSSYLELPTHHGERARYHEASNAIGGYQVIVDGILADLDNGDQARAHALRETDLGPAAEHADFALEQLVLYHSDRVVEIGLQIQKARRHATLISYALHGSASLVALLALGLVLRGLRTQTQVEEERTRLVEVRAHELEMFASRVAHDIKNPLAAIALRVTMSTNGSEAKMREALLRTGRSVERINEIVEGLLDFARAGGHPVAGARSDIVALADALVKELHDDAVRVDAELVTHHGESAEIAVPSWAATVILGNLVRNALKFIVESPGVVRRIDVRVQDLGGRVRVEVEDTGPGIPEGLPIFEPYVRSRDTRQPGLGLGLATVKRLVETYGGTVGVRSHLGRGSCFWFELAKPSPATDAPASGVVFH